MISWDISGTDAPNIVLDNIISPNIVLLAKFSTQPVACGLRIITVTHCKSQFYKIILSFYSRPVV